MHKFIAVALLLAGFWCLGQQEGRSQLIGEGVWKTKTSAAPTSPALTNLWSWVKADAGTFQDSALTTPATADGNPLGGWVDQSGNSRNWTQSVSGSRATFKTAIVNGKPIVRFVAGSPLQFLNGPDPSALTAGETWIVTAALNESGSTGGLYAMGNYTGGTADTLYPFSDNNIYDNFGSVTARRSFAKTVTLTSFHLYNAISTSAEWTATMDGTQIFTTATNSVGFLSTTYLGQAIDQSEGYSGDIAEVLVYSAKQSAPDSTTTKAYIAGKYALTIN